MHPKMVSVIIPCYNQGHFLGEALASLYKANEADLEIIIVNDGSSDENTNRIISELDTSQYIVLNQHNQGLAMARNNGIAISKGKYILPLDADNYINPELISKAISVLDSNNSIDIVYTDCVVFGDLNENRVVGEFDFTMLLHGNYIDALAIFRREVWEVNKGYDANMPFMGWEDWDFWINSHTNGFKFYYINQSLYHYRHLGGSMLRSKDLEVKFVKVRQYIFSKYVQYKSDELLRAGLTKIAKGEKLSGFVEIIHSSFFPKLSALLFLQRVKLGLAQLYK
jgi:glycosyltransferase involved in cell wall biosynthesis